MADRLFIIEPWETCPIAEQMQHDQSASWQHVACCFACLRNMARMYYVHRLQENRQQDEIFNPPAKSDYKGSN